MISSFLSFRDVAPFRRVAALGLTENSWAWRRCRRRPRPPRPKPAAAAAAAGAGQGQAMLLETAGKWQAFSSQQGRSKVCYALSKAESRSPANLKDVEGLLFVSNRPGEGVRNEIAS
ncbi:hypothetical protein [Streptomyces shaanxiensis]